ncbi:MAG TPA: translocation/assembly module TamB domain-containing protein [Longimicrobiales bacterium]|nr:translocation/assembly module TamB domain-containing protein [Longimicrobiales bacterium]
MSRSLRLAGYIGIGVAAGLLVATLAILLLTRTDWGMERARRFAVSWLDERIEGELTLGRLTGPGLLGGVVIHDFGIIDPRGRPFLSSDSLELAYDWRTLLAGRIVLNRVVLHRPRIVIERLPGDTAWNYEMVFPPGDPGPPSARSFIMFNDARILDGTATVRMPFEPAGAVEPGDTARILLETVPGGLARTMRFEDVTARLGRVIWESPIEKGRLFDIEMLQARGFIWREPFFIRNARGSLTTRDSIITFDMPDVSMAASNAGILGRVVIRDGRDDVDVRIDGRRLAFDDLHWLYPNLPTEGGGSLALRIRTLPDGMLWLAEDARLAAPGTRIAGTFGVVTGDSLYFTQVNLRASPLDVRFIEQLLPDGLPVDGLLVGTVEVRGPLSALETTGDVRLTGGVGAGSRMRWRGVLDVRNGHVAARSMRADVTDFQLALVSAFSPGMDVGGTVTGRIQGTGRLDRLTFSAALEHATTAGTRSTLDGTGSISGHGPGRQFDIDLTATPVTLEDLAVQVPALRGLEGELRGPVRLSGTGDDLGFDAELTTPGGPLALYGRVVRAGDTRRVTGSATADRFRLQALRPDLPDAIVSGTLTIDLTGDDVVRAHGPVVLLLDSARIGNLPIGRTSVAGALLDGVLTVDSAFLHTVAGIGRARGTLALADGRTGQLDAAFASESLTPLEVHIFGDVAATPDAEPRLAGRLDAVASLTGRLGDFGLDVSLRGDELVYGAFAAERLRGQVAARHMGSGRSELRLTALADSLTAWSHRAPLARLEARGAGDSTVVTLDASAGAREQFHARGTIRQDAAGGRAAELDGLRIDGSRWQLHTPATVQWSDGVAELDGLDLRGPGSARARAAGRLAWAGPATVQAAPVEFSATLAGMPFMDLLRLVRSGEAGAGAVDGSLRISGGAADPVIEAEISGRDIIYSDVRMDRAFAEASYAGRALDLHVEAQHGGRRILTGGGRVPVDLRFMATQERRLDEPLRVTIAADSLPAAVPLGLLSGFAGVRGRVDGTMAVSGTTLDPDLSGGFVIRDGGADWDVSGVRYRDVNGTIVLESDRAVRIDIAARATDPRSRAPLARGTAGGMGRIAGLLDFTTLGDPGFDLTFSANHAYAARRRDVEASVSGDLRLGGRYSRPEISGTLRVEQGALFIDEIYRQYLIVGLETGDPSLLSLVDTSLVAVRPLLASSQNTFIRNLQVRNLQVVVGNDAWLRSRDMDVEVTGDLTVSLDRREQDLRLSGALNVERGTYTLYYPPIQSRRFQVREGSIEFPGTPGIDPNLAITAAYRARARGQSLDVLAVVGGTLQNPRVRLTSDAQPPISESDLASYLFFGVPTWEVASTGGPGAADVRAIADRALRPSMLGYASSGLQTLVQSAGLLDYVSLTSADAGADDRASGLSSFLSDTQLELGRYLGPTVFVGYTQRLGNATYDPALRVEWRFLPEFSFEMFAEDHYARTPSFRMRPETAPRKVYGFSLFREWGF